MKGSRRLSSSFAAATLAAAFLPAGPPEAPPPPPVAITTDPARVAGCQKLGGRTLSDTARLDALVREAADRGANVLELRSLTATSISGDFYRCGDAVRPSPLPSAAPVAASQVPTATPASLPTPAPTPLPSGSRRSGRKAPAASAIGTAERQRQAQEELDTLKASVRVVEDAQEVEGCERRGEAKGLGVTEDSLREAAVGALANVVVIRRGEAGTVSGEYFRCSRAQYQRIPTATPSPGP